MYIESSFANPGDKAELSSYRYFASNSNCKMSLWYHMYGSGVGSLFVKIKKQDGTYDVKHHLSNSQVKSGFKVNAELSLSYRHSNPVSLTKMSCFHTFPLKVVEGNSYIIKKMISHTLSHNHVNFIEFKWCINCLII